MTAFASSSHCILALPSFQTFTQPPGTRMVVQLRPSCSLSSAGHPPWPTSGLSSVPAYGRTSL